MYLGIFAGWILLVFLSTAGPSDRAWFAHWDKWDARWYAQIWREGYLASDPRALAFPPGYSFAAGLVAKIFSTSFFGTATVLNLAALWTVAAFLSDWFSRKFGTAPYACFAFILSAPAAYFAFTAYSDVFFMLLLWVALWLNSTRVRPLQPKRSPVNCKALWVILSNCSSFSK